MLFFWEFIVLTCSGTGFFRLFFVSCPTNFTVVITVENIILIGSLLLIASILAKKLSTRIAVPALIIFLIVGMLAGAEGILGIDFQNYELAQFVGVIALNFILFNGGLSTNWKSVKPILAQGIVLSTFGVFLTALTLGAFIWWISDYYIEGGLGIFEALLLGSIVSSTDAAAVFSILRSKGLGLKANLKPTLELESGSNDPMAYFLTLAFITFVQSPDQSLWAILPFFFKQIGIGVICGIAFSWLGKELINRINIDFDGLYPVLTIGIMYFVFSATDSIGGNGFLAVYLSGLYLGNKNIVRKYTILDWFDGMSWLMQIVLFLILGLLVTPSHLLPIIGLGLLVSAFLIICARPISVLLCLIPFKMSMPRRLYISWVGLRGAVPIVFATYPLIAGVPHADIYFNVVFFVSLTSVLLQGSTIPVVAKWLHMSLPTGNKTKSPVDVLRTEGGHTFLREINIPEDNSTVGKQVKELEFPEKGIIAMISRNNEFITPNGTTVIKPNDMLIVLYENPKILDDIYSQLGLNRWQEEQKEEI